MHHTIVIIMQYWQPLSINAKPYPQETCVVHSDFDSYFRVHARASHNNNNHAIYTTGQHHCQAMPNPILKRPMPTVCCAQITMRDACV